MPKAPVFVTARRTFHLLGSAALVVAALYWGQKILIPFALAILLAFVLDPLVSWLGRRGVRRVPAVLLVVCLAFLLLGAAGWAMATQASHLVDDLPRYKEKVREKIGQLQRAGRHGFLATVQDFLDEVEKTSQPAEAARGPVVRLEPARPSFFTQLQAVVGRFLGAFSAALAVFLLVICMLVYREDLRNQLIRLAGALRFVPLIGVWLVAPFPAALALISSPGLTQALAVLALFLLLELLSANVIESRVCGPSIGVAPVPTESSPHSAKRAAS